MTRRFLTRSRHNTPPGRTVQVAVVTSPCRPSSEPTEEAEPVYEAPAGRGLM